MQNLNDESRILSDVRIIRPMRFLNWLHIQRSWTSHQRGVYQGVLLPHVLVDSLILLRILASDGAKCISTGQNQLRC